jgi:hypothetical protein
MSAKNPRKAAELKIPAAFRLILAFHFVPAEPPRLSSGSSRDTRVMEAPAPVPASPPAPPAAGPSEEEEDVCRVCRGGAEPDSPLFYPCLCKGSIRFVHKDCLLQWLRHSGATRCDLCKHPFAFTPSRCPPSIRLTCSSLRREHS